MSAVLKDIVAVRRVGDPAGAEQQHGQQKAAAASVEAAG